MKLNHEVVTQIGFKENLIKKPNERFYALEHNGLIIFLVHHFLGNPGTADLWALENNEVETVADMLTVQYKIGANQEAA